MSYTMEGVAIDRRRITQRSDEQRMAEHSKAIVRNVEPANGA